MTNKLAVVVFFKPTAMKRLLFLTFTIIILIVSFLIFWEFILPLLNPSNGRLSISTTEPGANVFFDGKEVGTTPFYSDHLRVGDHKIEVAAKSDPGFRFTTNTTLNSTTLSVLDLDLANTQAFSAGENLYFKEGLSGLSLLTRPEGAKITIDDKSVGSAPVNQSLDTGVHSLKVEKTGYLPREVSINSEPGYKLLALVYLSANPFETVTKIDSSSKASLFRITNSVIDLSSSYPDWVAGLKHAQSSLDELSTHFDFLIDPNGITYILNPTEWSNKKTVKSLVNIGYLTKKESDQVSSKAQTEWGKIKNEFN